MLVEVDADQLHVAGLLLADQITRTAHIEIARADREAGTEPVERLQCVETFHRRVRDRRIAVGEQHDLSASTRPTDAPAQLVELGQTEPVGVMDDHRVRARDIQSGLDDVGREEDVAVAGRKSRHRVI